MAKIAQYSAGKHVRDNCFEDVLIEMKTFGIKVEKRVLQNFFIEAIHSLRWETFWLRQSIDKFNDEIT